MTIALPAQRSVLLFLAAVVALSGSASARSERGLAKRLDIEHNDQDFINVIGGVAGGAFGLSLLVNGLIFWVFSRKIAAKTSDAASDASNEVYEDAVSTLRNSG